ncbi:MAG TPA: DUF4382 domain-containing protein [Prolixibacteraceae bacterium]|nr:DUF4382 domain-containing protein [Prolixibacteraceae bacterium]
MKTKLIQLTMILLASALFGLTACQKDSESMEAGKGKLVVKLTDAPFPVDLVDQALVTIDKIEIRLAADSLLEGEEMESSSFIVLSEETMQFNLLELRNGITAEMLAMHIDTGSYDMIRMHVVESEIILKDGTSYTMKVPGGSSSGLKIKIIPALSIEGNETSEVLLDFDVSKSFVVLGNVKAKDGIKGFTFKPVIRAVWQEVSASIEGKVVDAEGAPLKEAYVQVIQADTVFTSALTNEAGEYAVIGIPVGAYQMVCEKEGFVSEVVDVVEVEKGIKTVVNFEMLAE